MIQTADTAKPTRQTVLRGEAKERIWLAAALLLAVCGALYFLRLGSFGLLDAYYPAATREMVEAGNLMVPKLNYQLYFSKPIMTYWLIGSAYNMFGISELSSRIWSAILSTLLVLACFFATRAVTSTRSALIAALTLASAPLLVTSCRVSMIDTYFTVFFGMAVCSIITVMFSKHKKWWPAIYVSLALAVLTKGPAGLVLFGFGAACFAAAIRPSKQQAIDWLKQLRILPGIALFSAITLPWFIAIGLATNWLWPQVFFVYENLGRFGGHTNVRHYYWWWYLLPLTYGFFPWSLYLPTALVGAFRNKGSEKPIAADVTPDAFTRNSSNALVFAASYAVAILLFFSASKTQYDIYILPAWCPLALVLGISVERWINVAQTSSALPRTLGFISKLFGIIGALLLPAGIVAAFLIRGLHDWMYAYLILSTTILSISWVSQRILMTKRQITAAVFTMLIGTCFGFSLAVPILTERFYESKYKDVQELAKTLVDCKGQVGQYGDFMLGLLFYRQGPIDYTYDLNQIIPASQATAAQLRDAHTPLYLITTRGMARRLLARKDVTFTLINERGDWQVFRSSDATMKRPPTLEDALKNQGFAGLMHIDSTFTMPYGGGSYPDRLEQH
jgi:4-amino-4-deoxy-L-arabinose transferase-like glycosyltransferase